MLRLRGGGGYEWKFINKRTKQETTVRLEENVGITMSLLAKLAKQLGVKPEEVKPVGNFKEKK